MEASQSNGVNIFRETKTMRMTIKGNEARIAMTRSEAVELIGRLAHTVNQAARHGQWFLTMPMGINQDQAKHDMPGVVYLDVAKETT
jgi:hypothetical protein